MNEYKVTVKMKIDAVDISSLVFELKELEINFVKRGTKYPVADVE
jgi:hypothetical protein